MPLANEHGAGTNIWTDCANIWLVYGEQIYLAFGPFQKDLKKILQSAAYFLEQRKAIDRLSGHIVMCMQSSGKM